MLDAWILLTLGAAFLQNIRSSLQVALQGRLSNAGATAVRFLFALPAAGAVLVCARVFLATPLPDAGPGFFAYAVVGGLAQIVATACLLHAATLRAFAVATAYSKTEPLLAVAFGIVLLSEPVGAGASLGIVLCVAAVVGLGIAKGGTASTRRLAWLRDAGAGWGILSGVLFGLAAVSYRGASLSLVWPEAEPLRGAFLLRSTLTLTWVLALQSVASIVYLRLREPGELGRMRAAWRPALWVGLSGAAASVGWFSAMTLENAAYVRTLGQVELLFAMASSRFYFRERLSRGEVLAIGVLLAGLVVLLALR